jgi:hypothetical protein
VLYQNAQQQAAANADGPEDDVVEDAEVIDDENDEGKR